MDDTGALVREDHIAFRPRNVRDRDLAYLMSFRYASVPVYWRNEGFPFIIKEFFSVEPGEELIVYPVGTHTLHEAVVFINRRITDVYDAVIRKIELGHRPRPLVVAEWKLGPPPGEPEPPEPFKFKDGLRKIG